VFDPRLVPRAPAFWMQTTGVALLAAKRCNLACADACPGSHCAHRLLYLAAVRGDRLPAPSSTTARSVDSVGQRVRPRHGATLGFERPFIVESAQIPCPDDLLPTADFVNHLDPQLM
jgi:hypothetical protein